MGDRPPTQWALRSLGVVVIAAVASRHAAFVLRRISVYLQPIRSNLDTGLIGLRFGDIGLAGQGSAMVRFIAH